MKVTILGKRYLFSGGCYVFAVAEVTFFAARQFLTSCSSDQKLSRSKKCSIYHQHCNIRHGFYDSVKTMTQSQTQVAGFLQKHSSTEYSLILLPRGTPHLPGAPLIHPDISSSATDPLNELLTVNPRSVSMPTPL